MQEENEAEEEVLDGVSAVLSVALKRWGDAVLPWAEALMPAIGQVRRPHRSMRRLHIPDVQMSCMMFDRDHCVMQPLPVQPQG